MGRSNAMPNAGKSQTSQLLDLLPILRMCAFRHPTKVRSWCRGVALTLGPSMPVGRVEI